MNAYSGHPDNYRADGAPDGWVSRAQIFNEQFSEDVGKAYEKMQAVELHLQKMDEQFSRLMKLAEEGEWVSDDSWAVRAISDKLVAISKILER